ncbi:hypothetical protein ACFL08_01890 [Patescibacteria group bacterium]
MLTKKIKLSKKNKNIYHLIQAGVFALFALSLINLGAKIIFPSKHFTLDAQDINASENNISEINITSASITFNASSGEPFSGSNIKIIGNNNAKMPELSIKKSYEAFMYPETGPITSLGENEINSLVTKGDSVFIIGNGKLYPIDRPETFESAGFKWENIQDSQDIDLNTYEKQKLFNYKAIHPDGTVFKTIDTNKYYYILNEEKHEIQGDLLNNPRVKKEAIEVNENISTETCISKRGFIKKTTYLCHIPLDKIQKEPGKDYKITITNINASKINTVETKFIKSFNKYNFKRGVMNIINKTNARYSK